MNAWPFVIAAYAAMLSATAGLLAWASATMRSAERASDALKRSE